MTPRACCLDSNREKDVIIIITTQYQRLTALYKYDYFILK